MSTPPPTFPVELWLMIIEHLRDEESPQHMSRLAQTSKWFHEVVNDALYPIMRLQSNLNAEKFAFSMINLEEPKFVARPEVKSLVREVRHHGDMGFQNFTYSCSLFYEELATFHNLETLIMRPRWSATNPSLWSTLWANLVYDTCMDPNGKNWKPKMRSFFKQMEKQDGPAALDNPFGTHWSPTNSSFPDEEHVRADMTRFCDGYLESCKPSSLTSCHIGTDSLQKPNDAISTFFNWSICELSQLKKLCITGANLDLFDHHFMPDAGDMKALEELTLLNCRISPPNIAALIESAAMLKRLTIRGPNCSDQNGREDGQYMEIGGCLEYAFAKSLEALDIDIYWGTPMGTSLYRMRALKKLTVTLYTILGGGTRGSPQQIEAVVPPSLETLVVRHEAGITLPFKQLHATLLNGKLQNLRSLIFQIPENIRVAPTTSMLRNYAKSWIDRFSSLGVKLQVSVVPYPSGMVKYDACSCECLEVYHRFPFHPRAVSGFSYDDYEQEYDESMQGSSDETSDETGGESSEGDMETDADTSFEEDGEHYRMDLEYLDKETMSEDGETTSDSDWVTSDEESSGEDRPKKPYLQDLASRRHTVITSHAQYLRWIDGFQ